MTKSRLQKELKEKVKEGVKPSDIRKLKRSKSADDIPPAPPLPQSSPLNRSKSSEHPQDVQPILITRPEPFADPKYPYTTLISQSQELEQLKKETTAKSDTIALLRKKIDNLEKSNPPNALLNDQLQEKQKEIEELRARLDRANNSLSSLSTELSILKTEQSTLLDDNLSLKHQSLKDWWQQYQQTQKLEKELKENVDYASEELIEQDKKINSLQGQVVKLKQTNQSLTKDLDLAHKLIQLRKNPLPTSPLNSPWMSYALTFLLIGVTLYLTTNFR